MRNYLCRSYDRTFSIGVTLHANIPDVSVGCGAVARVWHTIVTVALEAELGTVAPLVGTTPVEVFWLQGRRRRSVINNTCVKGR